MVGCIIQPMPEKEISLNGVWCKDSTICYEFEDGKVRSGDPIMSHYDYDYSVINVSEGGYYQEGIIVSDLFKYSFGDVYYNVKSDVLIMYFGGILFRFERVWQ